MGLASRIRDRIQSGQPAQVWTPVDFLDLGPRTAVDKTLQRLVRAQQLRRIDRGFFDVPHVNALTKKLNAPDYRQVLDAVSRRDQTRMLVDGLTAANELGLTSGVPSQVVVHTDGRRRSLCVGRVTIDFKRTAPSKLYWAGRPAMKVVQALHWSRERLALDRTQLVARLGMLLDDADRGAVVLEDLLKGLTTLPVWMQGVVRELCDPSRQALPGSRVRRTADGTCPAGEASQQDCVRHSGTVSGVG